MILADLDKVHPAGLAPGSYLCLAVSDTGMGVTAATLARASEPFFTTKPLSQGTGLGLAMARGFAHQSGGAIEIEIESALGQGTTVTLWFSEVTGVLLTSDLALPESTDPSSRLRPVCWSWTTMRWCARWWSANWKSRTIASSRRVTAWMHWSSSTEVLRWIC